MMKFVTILLFFWLLSEGGRGYGQSACRLVFYNVENLFDTENDPLTWDDDFTPFGKQHWNTAKYTDKLLKLATAIQAVGEGQWPVLVGLCEVENRKVLSDLTGKTSLADANYSIVHRDSPDKRGIDVALLYKPERFYLLEEDFLPVVLEEEADFSTRDILYARGILDKRDTLHVFVCHFPSMTGGEAESEWRRERAASVVKRYVRSIQAAQPRSAILIMGDLNGKADRKAQTAVLGTRSSDTDEPVDTVLYNTAYYLLHKDYGSYKYKGKWQTIDQIIVSGALLNGRHAYRAVKRSVPFSAPFLLEEDKTFYGYKPFRTYLGPRYHGGYSDHLPVYLDLNRTERAEDKVLGF